MAMRECRPAFCLAPSRTALDWWLRQHLCGALRDDVVVCLGTRILAFLTHLEDPHSVMIDQPTRADPSLAAYSLQLQFDVEILPTSDLITQRVLVEVTGRIGELHSSAHFVCGEPLSL